LCALWREECPVAFVFGSLVGPGFDFVDVGGGEGFSACVGGRHAEAFVFVGDAFKDFAVFEGGVFDVETKACFAIVGVWPVAVEALLAQDGPDIAIEGELGCAEDDG